jgi:hypothetical protein
MNRTFLFAGLSLMMAPTSWAQDQVALSDEGDSVRGVLHAQAFEVDQPFVFDFVAEQPMISKGTLVVVRVDPAFAMQRQGLNPVLYAGAHPVQIATVAQVPDASGTSLAAACIVGLTHPNTDLDTTPFFFGTPVLPERITQQRGALELEAARAAGFVPVPVDELAKVRQESGALLSVADQAALYDVARTLTDRCVATE